MTDSVPMQIELADLILHGNAVERRKHPLVFVAAEQHDIVAVGDQALRELGVVLNRPATKSVLTKHIARATRHKRDDASIDRLARGGMR